MITALICCILTQYIILFIYLWRIRSIERDFTIAKTDLEIRVKFLEGIIDLFKEELIKYRKTLQTQKETQNASE